MYCALFCLCPVILTCVARTGVHHMEIRAIEVLTRAMLEVDRALDTANTTLSSLTGKKHYNHQLSPRR